ncbi:hypothetical protein WICPIJ_005780 [Wickerhamomyces pijperi]|uniref:Uncharacterized protein n=1 Tax=Wickerhamomyces pijperi TaxID=599730 RepID=A0A9P8Q2Y3_WICPI|nr:hypothetical protein WICPIJ_005780 [Wickerhamomyces pijperi]
MMHLLALNQRLDDIDTLLDTARELHREIPNGSDRLPGHHDIDVTCKNSVGMSYVWKTVDLDNVKRITLRRVRNLISGECGCVSSVEMAWVSLATVSWSEVVEVAAAEGLVLEKFNRYKTSFKVCRTMALFCEFNSGVTRWIVSQTSESSASAPSAAEVGT